MGRWVGLQCAKWGLNTWMDEGGMVVWGVVWVDDGVEGMS